MDMQRKMEPYFYQLQQDFISISCKQKLLSFTVNNNEDFKAYQMKNGKYDGNNYLKIDPTFHPDLNALRNSCKIDFYLMLIMHKPEQEVVKHRDGPFGRNCVLSIPLSPVQDYAYTLFYDENGEYVTQCDFVNHLPAFLNTQQTHSLINGENIRVNLQLCFEQSFEHVIELYKNNQLFV